MNLNQWIFILLTILVIMIKKEPVKPKINYSKQGKKNRAAGRLFEARVREDLEKWVGLLIDGVNTIDYNKNKIVPAKRKIQSFS